MAGSITKIPGSRFADGHDRRRAVYRDHLGKQHVRQFRTLADAQAWLDGVTHDKVAGIRTERSRQTLRELFDEVHAGRPYAPKTLELHEDSWNHIPERIQHARISDIDAETVDAVLAAVEKPAARDQLRKLLSTLFAEGVNKRRLAVNPAKRPARRRTRAELKEAGAIRKQLRILKPEQLTRLVAEIPDRYRALIQVQAFVGLRPGEAAALTVGQLDPFTRTLTIDRSLGGETKTGQARTITLPQIVVDILAAHVTAFVDDPTDGSALMFGRIDLNNFRSRTFTPAVRRADIDHLRINDLRHYAASFAIANGADVYSVQQMLGHAKPSITLDVYGALWQSSAEELAERLDEAIRTGLAGN